MTKFNIDDKVIYKPEGKGIVKYHYVQRYNGIKIIFYIIEFENGNQYPVSEHDNMVKVPSPKFKAGDIIKGISANKDYEVIEVNDTHYMLRSADKILGFKTKAIFDAVMSIESVDSYFKND